MTHSAPAFVGKKFSMGDRYAVYADLDITSYGTSTGEALTAGEFGLKSVESIIPLWLSDEKYVWQYDVTNAKMRAFKNGATGLTGSSTYTPTDGNAIVTETWGNIRGGNFANQVASGAAGVNDAVVHASAAVTTSIVNTGITNPVDGPRNLKLVLSSAGGGTLPADCGTVTMIGTDQFDAAVTEVLALSPVNSVVLGAGGVVFIVGTKIFKTLTSYQFSVDLAASVADIAGSVGLGTKLGLAKTLDPATEAAIQKVFKNDTAIAASTYVGDATYTALDLGANLADNDDVVIQYTTDSDAAGGSVSTTIGGSSVLGTEASSTNDVGKARVMAIGK